MSGWWVRWNHLSSCHQKEFRIRIQIDEDQILKLSIKSEKLEFVFDKVNNIRRILPSEKCLDFENHHTNSEATSDDMIMYCFRVSVCILIPSCLCWVHGCIFPSYSDMCVSS
jgi:hypothetical protein